MSGEGGFSLSARPGNAGAVWVGVLRQAQDERGFGGGRALVMRLPLGARAATGAGWAQNGFPRPGPG